jgi:DivIVA domain-containing protein
LDTYDVERIRSATFRDARRGYDRREVEQFLASVADWLESGAQDEARAFAVKRKLERAGNTTARILATAQEEAEKLIAEAKDEATRTRSEAAGAARETTENARAKARRTVEEGEQRRVAIETVIKDLVAKRDAVLQELDRLAGEVAASVKEHRPAAGADPFAKPALLDPADRRPSSDRSAAATAAPAGAESG